MFCYSKSDALHRDGYEQFYDNIAPMERHLNVAQQVGYLNFSF